MRIRLWKAGLYPPLQELLPALPGCTHHPVWLSAAPAMRLRVRATRQQAPTHIMLLAVPKGTHP